MGHTLLDASRAFGFKGSHLLVNAFSRKQSQTTCLSSFFKSCHVEPKHQPLKLFRLALIGALSRMNSVPVILTSAERALQHQLHPLRHMGCVIPSAIHSPVVLEALQERALHVNELVNGLEGAFQVIVDTGCTNTATPCKEDFEICTALDKPVKLHGIAGNQDVTHGGIVKHECINSKGEIVVIKTFAFHNPHQNVRLFAPTACFRLRADKKGLFTLSHSKTELVLPEGHLPIQIEPCSFMPLLTCFHDADKAAMNLANPAALIDSDTNSNLTGTQKQLLQFHFRLGHLGFKQLQWLLCQGIHGAVGIQCGSTTVEAPKCQACLIGGQQRTPIADNHHSQTKKDKLKREQLSPGQ